MKKNKSGKNYISFDNTFYDYRNNRVTDPIGTADFRLIQAVDTQFFEGFSYQTHTQICGVELTYVLSGIITCITDGVSYPVSAGQIHVTFQGEEHALHCKTACRFRNFAFDIKEESAFFVYYQSLRGTCGRRIDHAERMRRLISDSVAEFYAWDAESVLHLNCMAGLLVLDLYRSCSSGTRLQLANVQGTNLQSADLQAANEDAVLLSALNYMDHHFQTMQTVEEVATYTNSAYTTLAKHFLSAYGISLKTYLNFKKMEFACEKLGEKEITTAQLAEMLNFSSAYSFSRAFKQYVGLSPRDYRLAPFPLPSILP